MTHVLVTGATGYVGGRLVPQLLAAGHDVSVYVRSPWKLRDVPWRARVRVFKGDLSDAVATRRAMNGVDVAFYLVHSMSAGRDFERAEKQAAQTFASAAADAKLERIIYLGGLHPDEARLSKHLSSRAAVGKVFLACPVPAIVLQAGIVIGSGSASFEMIRHLTEVLPYMPAPRWVRNHVQPIAVRDVLRYLVRSVSIEERLNRTFDIGGPDILRYGQMMNGYAVEAGLPQRHIASLPVLTPWLASQWVSLVSPIPRQIAVPIIASLQNDCVMSEHDIDQYIAPPEEGLLPYRTAVSLALTREAEGQIETSWQRATVPGAPSDPLPSDPDWAGHTVFTDLRERASTASADAVWNVIEAIGGEKGWHSFPLAWAARGWIDRLVGGVGESVSSARRLLPEGADRAAVLGRAAAVSRNHLQRHGCQHPSRGREFETGDIMRLWSLHPRYFDRQALIACWREGLLAQAVIVEPGRGYSRHPQLRRFQDTEDPQSAIGDYLSAIVDEADARGYRFVREKIRRTGAAARLTVNDGQLAYEWRHLAAKLQQRSPEMWARWQSITTPDPHPSFTVVGGPIADWEKIDSRTTTATPPRPRDTKPPTASKVHLEEGAVVPNATAATRDGAEHATQPMSYDAILLSGFGGPEGQEDVLPFLRNVTRGRGIPDERLEEVAHHYRQFGGVSPINEQNRQLKGALEAALSAAGLDLPIYWGNRNWAPYLDDALTQAAADGVRKMIAIPTSAYSSYSSCRQYREDWADALEASGLQQTLQIDKVRQFFSHPGFIQPFITGVQEGIAAARRAGHELSNIEVLFSTHSIPTEDASRSGAGLFSDVAGGGYVAQHLAVAEEVIAKAAPGVSWQLVYQSRSGPPSQPWLEPDINDALRALDARTAVLIVPLGFVSDHMEVMWDLDEEATTTAAELGLWVTRTPTPGTHPDFVSALIDLVQERISGRPVGMRANATSIGAWFDVCRPGCCENPRLGFRPAIAGLQP